MIELKLNQEMKSKLEQDATKCGLTVYAYLRKLIIEA